MYPLIILKKAIILRYQTHDFGSIAGNAILSCNVHFVRSSEVQTARSILHCLFDMMSLNDGKYGLINGPKVWQKSVLPSGGGEPDDAHRSPEIRGMLSSRRLSKTRTRHHSQSSNVSNVETTVTCIPEVNGRRM